MVLETILPCVLKKTQGRREKLWALMQRYDTDLVRAPFIRLKATKWHKLDISSSIGSIVNLIYIKTNFLHPNWLAHTFYVKSTILYSYQFKILKR